jgi:hypothetical protein
MFELEECDWERNSSTRTFSAQSGQPGLFTHPVDERARRVLSKLRQTPRLIQAARDNIADPPGIFVKVGIETMRGALKFIDDDLPKAFASVDDLHLLGDLADAQAEASQTVGAFVQYLETDVAPRARASFRLGREKFEQKLRLDEGITLSIERLLAIATRELKATQEAFKSIAGRITAETRWPPGRARRSHPKAGGSSRSDAGRSMSCHVSRAPDRLMPDGERITVRRPPISIAGRSRACGRLDRSRPSRHARITT